MKKDRLKRIAVLGITAVMIVTISLVLASQGTDEKFVGVAPGFSSLKKIDYDTVPPVPIEQSCCIINHWGTISVVEGVEQQIFEVQGSYIPYSNLWITIYCTSGGLSVTIPYKEPINVSITQSTTIHGTYLESVNVTGTGRGYYKISHCCKQHKIESPLISAPVGIPVPAE